MQPYQFCNRAVNARDREGFPRVVQSAGDRDAVALFIGGCIMTELEKLPQARRYLRAARWGLKNHWTKRYKAAAIFFT